MESERYLPNDEPYWKTMLTDLESTGILRGRVTAEAGRPGGLNAQVQVALAWMDTGARLRAAWALVLARHTGSSEVAFLTSFDEQTVGLVRATVPTGSTVVDWLAQFQPMLTTAREQGPLPASVLAQLREEGVAYDLPAFITVAANAKSFPPREQIEGPLMVVVRLDLAQIELYYDMARFERAEVQAVGDHFNIVLQAMAKGPQTAIGRLPLPTDK